MRSLSRSLYGLQMVLVLLAGAEPAIADDASDPVPRYRLKVGQELKYHGSSDFKYDNGSLGNESDWQVWVVRANDDGSWRLLLRSSQKSTQTFNGQKRDNGSADVTMAYCDLFPDGRIVANDSFGYRLDPSSIFPRLPKDAEEAKKGWQASDANQGTRTEFKVSGDKASEGNDWTFEGIRHSPMDRIYLSSSRARYVLDARRGIVKRIETENTQGYGFNGKGTGTEELTSVEEQDAGRVKTLSEESDRYFEANRAYQDLLTKANKEPKDVEALLSQAETRLKEAGEKVTIPVLREQIDHQIKNHSQMASYYAEEAKNKAEVLGKDAADWETKDLEGKTHSLKGYRGKVVILDFWYRGCGWCIRAMPQIKELAGDFKGEPVVVLGMNTDRQEKDAKFVVDEMGLNYPTLKAEGLPEKYKVRGFPTLIIIDQDGKVADVHVGYSPKLREEVSRSVKNLLSRK